MKICHQACILSMMCFIHYRSISLAFHYAAQALRDIGDAEDAATLQTGVAASRAESVTQQSGEKSIRSALRRIIRRRTKRTYATDPNYADEEDHSDSVLNGEEDEAYEDDGNDWVPNEEEDWDELTAAAAAQAEPEDEAEAQEVEIPTASRSERFSFLELKEPAKPVNLSEFNKRARRKSFKKAIQRVIHAIKFE